MEFVGFDWDKGNKDKCRKHGVSIAEIEGLFLDDPFIAPDLQHSWAERRFRAVGVTKKGRYLFVVFTRRIKNDDWYVRPISARYMHVKEVAAHEKEIS